MNSRRKVILYIAQSLDGYIARKDDSLDWLFDVDGEEDNGYFKFYETVDTILLGRRTYEWILEHEKGDFPYKGKECFVFSRTKNKDTEDVKFIESDQIPLIRELKEKQGKNIWLVGGSVLIHTFLEENLIDELIIQIAPTIIGDGIPLFHKIDKDVKLKLKEISKFNQMSQLHYEIIK